MPGADKKLILIVDDTPTNIAVVSGLLKDSFQTKVATNGEKALAIATGAEKPDLILLDVMMPRLSGFEVCQKLKSDPATKKIMILMVTALNEQGDIERAVKVGTNDFVSKPVNKFELLKRVENALLVKDITDENERLRQYILKMEESGGRR